MASASKLTAQFVAPKFNNNLISIIFFQERLWPGVVSRQVSGQEPAMLLYLEGGDR